MQLYDIRTPLHRAGPRASSQLPRDARSIESVSATGAAGEPLPHICTGVGSAVLLRRTRAGGLTGAGADAACKGVISDGECVDKTHIDAGACGLCYGDGPDKSLPTENAYFYRMVSDVYAYEGVLVRAACTRPLALGTRDCRHGTAQRARG